MNKPKFSKAYVDRVTSMAKQAWGWFRANPDAEPIMTFNTPKDVGVICDLAQAIKLGIIIVDDEGKRMLTELGWLEDNAAMPTYTMVRVAIETALADPEAKHGRTTTNRSRT